MYIFRILCFKYLFDEYFFFIETRKLTFRNIAPPRINLGYIGFCSVYIVYYVLCKFIDFCNLSHPCGEIFHPLWGRVQWILLKWLVPVHPYLHLCIVSDIDTSTENNDLHYYLIGAAVQSFANYGGPTLREREREREIGR